MKSPLSIFVIVLCIGGYFFYISPTLSEIKGLAQKKAEYDNVLEKAQEIKMKRDAVLTEYNSIPADDLAKLNKIIPTKYDAAAFANDVNNLVSKYGIAVKGIKDNSTQPTDRSGIIQDTSAPYKTNTVTITLSGGYDGFLKFLDDLETSLRLMDVKSLSIKSTKDQKSSVDMYEYILEVGVYSLN